MAARSSVNLLRAWVWNGFDYRLQAWVINGRVERCQHPASRRTRAAPCCAQALWAGRPITGVEDADAVRLYPPEPCLACAPLERLAPHRRAAAGRLRQAMPAAPGEPCWNCHGTGAVAPALPA